MKKVLFSLVLVALLVSLVSVSAMAQGTKAPPVSVRSNVLVQGSAPILKQPWNDTKQPPSHPPYCAGTPNFPGACLFYGGDFNSSDSNANGLANESDIIIPAGGSTPNYGAATFTNFTVPAGQTWSVNGMLSNVLSGINGVSPATCYWEIRSGITAGNGGTLIAAGTDVCTFVATGRNGFGLNEFTAKTYFSPGVTLTAGKYYEITIPACTTSNGNCPNARYFLSDCEDKPPANKLGFEQSDDAWFNSNFFGFTYSATWGSSGVCAGLGCDRFSARPRLRGSRRLRTRRL